MTDNIQIPWETLRAIALPDSEDRRIARAFIDLVLNTPDGMLSIFPKRGTLASLVLDVVRRNSEEGGRDPAGRLETVWEDVLGALAGMCGLFGVSWRGDFVLRPAAGPPRRIRVEVDAEGALTLRVTETEKD